MKRMTFRKSLLLSGILLFSVLVSGQSTWACDEPARECSVQLDIKWVDLDLVGNWIYIWGEHFDNGDPPVVTLGGIHLGDIRSNEEWIVAKLPSVPKDIPYGQYGLRVSTGDGHKCKDKYSVKIHPAPPEKPPCEPTCPEKCPETCPQSCKGEKGDQGLQGPPGPAGIFGWKIVETPFKGSPWEATAYCSYGYVVTGGGFHAPDGAETIIASMPYIGPVQTGTQNVGWKVVVKPSDTQKFTTVYAICACVDPKAMDSPPMITAPPSDQTIGVDGTATFSVTATGACLTYQWQKLIGDKFINIPGATNSSYTTPTTVPEVPGAKFQCVVTNPAGSVISEVATLI